MAEQVEGHRDFYQFEVHILLSELAILKTALSPVCKYTPLKYWVTPIYESGHIG
ncbi:MULTISPECIES: DUF3240 family protein [unclassified Pseudoalteromonas]|uniref:DUF3240 family protein n=1 Tax=unclassified Pseudoalteromonas TaxID=194690 RepID=UPI00390CA020|nr:DUF3240 family protein [Ningiella sp. W23]